MRLDQSVYCIPCLCGVIVQTHEPEALCKACGRLLKVENWGGAKTHKPAEESEEPKTTRGENVMEARNLGFDIDSNGNVVLTMTSDDHQLLLLAMGYATATTDRNFQRKMIGLVNRLNEQNPNFRPYRISEDVQTCADCQRLRAAAYSDGTTPGFFFTECDRHRGQP